MYGVGGTSGPFSSTFERVPGGWRPICEDVDAETGEPANVEPWGWSRVARSAEKKRGPWGLDKERRKAFAPQRGGDTLLLECMDTKPMVDEAEEVA